MVKIEVIVPLSSCSHDLPRLRNRNNLHGSHNPDLLSCFPNEMLMRNVWISATLYAFPIQFYKSTGIVRVNLVITR